MKPLNSYDLSVIIACLKEAKARIKDESLKEDLRQIINKIMGFS